MVVVKDVIGMMESFLSLFLNFFHLSLQLIRFSDVEVVDCTEVLIKFIYERNWSGYVQIWNFYLIQSILSSEISLSLWTMGLNEFLCATTKTFLFSLIAGKISDYQNDRTLAVVSLRL